MSVKHGTSRVTNLQADDDKSEDNEESGDNLEEFTDALEQDEEEEFEGLTKGHGEDGESQGKEDDKSQNRRATTFQQQQETRIEPISIASDVQIIEQALTNVIETALLNEEEHSVNILNQENDAFKGTIKSRNDDEKVVDKAKYKEANDETPHNVDKTKDHHSSDEMEICKETCLSTAKISEQSFEEQRAEFYTEEKAKKIDKTSPSPKREGGWNEVLSALDSIKSKANTGLEKIYDALDPALPEYSTTLEGEAASKEIQEEEKSIKRVLERLSPQTSTESSKGGNWFMERFDRTFDRASDSIGSALLGGLKKLETTVGIAIEPISSCSSSSAPSEVELSVNEMESGHSTPISASSSGPGGDLYTSGWAALGALGRKTADLVSSTRDRLTPIIKSNWMTNIRESSKLQRSDLKKTLGELFEELSGNIALERLQVNSARAAVELKSRLKALPPKLLASLQGQIKNIGRQLDSLRESDLKVGDILDIGVFESSQDELLQRLVSSIEKSLQKWEELEESIEELRQRVESPLPVDTPTLYLYLVRSNLANILSASLHILLIFDYNNVDADDKEGESKVIDVVERLYGAISSSQRLVEATLIDTTRRPVIGKLVADDCAAARSLFGDAALTLQPGLKLMAFTNLSR